MDELRKPEVQVTQKTIDWLTMTDSGILTGLAQSKPPRLLVPVRWLLITIARALLILSMLTGSRKSWFFSHDQGSTWVESESFLGLPKDIKQSIWLGVAHWTERIGKD